MVTAKTRFALGDIVYHLDASGKIVVSSTVRGIRIDKNGNRIYSFGYASSFDWLENELYDTKDELANAQRNKVLNNNKVRDVERTEDVEVLALPGEKVYYFNEGKIYHGRIKYSEINSIGNGKVVAIEHRGCYGLDLDFIDDEHFVAKTKEELAEKVLKYYSEIKPQKAQ